MNILYIDGDGPLGGASRSLYESVNSLAPDFISPYFFVSRGTASIFYKKTATDLIPVRGMPKFDHTRYGYYRGWRWLIVLREIFYFPFMVFGLLSAKRKFKKIDIIHLNEFVYIIPGIFAKKIFSAPLVVHVRALTKGTENGLRSRIYNWLLRKFADHVIAIDGNVRNTLPLNLKISVINNSFSVKDDSKDKSLSEFLDRIPKNVFVVGFVGNFHRSKGVMEILSASKIISKDATDIHFIFVGGETSENKGLKGWLLKKIGLSQNTLDEMKFFIKENKLEHCVSLHGHTINISAIYKKIDLLLFPSHFDAPGRPVFEAGFFSKPSIICAKNPTIDTFVDKVTGLTISEKAPIELAAAIVYLKNNPDACLEMGLNAKKLAEQNFTPIFNSKKLFSIYKSLLSN